MLLLLLTSSRKCLLFKSDAWKVIFYLLMMLSHLLFLLKSQEFLFERSGVRLNDLVSASTLLWRYYLLWLRHSQNLITFFWWQEKNSLKSLKMNAICFWRGWDNRLKIFFATWIKSMTTMIFKILCRWVAWLIPYLMVKNSVLVLVMLLVWWSVLIIGLLWIYTCAIEKAMLFLTLASITMRAFDRVFDDLMARLSSCWICNLKCWSLLLLNK